MNREQLEAYPEMTDDTGQTTPELTPAGIPISL
jgi:hypothetical protein